MTDHEEQEVATDVSTTHGRAAHPRSPEALSPSASRRQLGNELRNLRVAADMTLEDASKEIERSPATMSRLERGSSTPRLVDVRALLDLYDERVPNVVTDDVRARLLGLVRDTRQGAWFNDYRDVLGSTLSSAELQRLVELETDAREILSFESDFVPGLLQTRSYARAIMETFRGDYDDSQLDRFVEFRIARQRILGSVRLHAVISEVALRRELGTPGVMREQLEKLVADIAKAEPSLTVQIAPLSLAIPAATTGPFAVMHLPDSDSDVVYLESRAGAKYLRNHDDVVRYDAEFATLAAKALDEKSSLELLKEMIDSQP